MIKGRRRLTSTILILLTLLLTTPTLFADGPGRKNVRGDRGRGRPAWFLKIPHFIFRNFRKFRNRYEFRKDAKHKKKNSLNSRRRNRRSGHGRRNRWFGRWH